MDSKAAIKTRLANLSPEQRARLLQQISALRKQKESSASSAQPYPLSLAQRRLWMLSQLSSDASAAYNIAAAFSFDKSLDPKQLQHAWQKLIANHEVLRSSFTHEGNELLQEPRDATAWSMQCQPLESGKNAAAQLQQLASEEAAKAFDLQKDWLIKVIYCETDSEQAGLIVVIHHIVCDGLSISSMIQELAQYYRNALSGADVLPAKTVLQYRDYVEYEALTDNSKAKDYWKGIFTSPPETLDALLDLPRPVQKDFSGRCVTRTLAATNVAAFEALCHAHNTTLYMGLMALTQLLLARFTNVDEVTLGTPVAGRPGAQFDKVVGPFVNTIALRQSIDLKQSFPELLTQVRRRVLGGFQHQGLAFDELVTTLGFAKDPSRSPLYDAMLGFTSAEDSTLIFGDSVGHPLSIPLAFSKVDLTFHFEKEGNGRLRLDLEYANGVILQSTALRLGEAWQTLIVSLLQRPERPIGELELQTEEERYSLLEDLNATARPYPEHASLVSEFRKTVRNYPEAIAVHAGQVQLSYSVLDDLSDKLANSLQSHAAFREGCRIALMLEKDERALIVILAILKTGCVYVPLAANTPLERVSQVITTAEAPLIFLESSRVEELQHLDVALIDTDDALAAAQKNSDIVSPLRNLTEVDSALEPAYLIFTSGSTGKPKGTLIEQRSVLRLVCNTDYHQVQANERVLLTGSLAFDAATFEIWGPLLNGGCVCVPEGTTLLEVHEFGALVDHYQVDTAFLTTGLFNQLIDNSVSAFSRLQTVLTGGEKISVEHVKKLLRAQPELRLLHVYGPTENTTFSTWHRIDVNDLELATIPIGRPIANSRIYLLDRNMQPVPIGVPGEIYCGGDGVARGYIETKDTVTRGQVSAFLKDPFRQAGTTQLYRTGDLAKWNHKRELVFLGRNDRQVKVRGFRVELGEVEFHLRNLVGVSDAFVQARGEAGSSELVAWLVASEEIYKSIGVVRDALKDSVPNYMLPAKLICLQRLPLNASGKVDVAALPTPEHSEADKAEPGQLLGKSEHDLARLYATVLGLTGDARTIDREANFFSLGGDSIRAIQLVSLARSEGYHFTLKDIFASETLAGLAATASVTSASAPEEALLSGPLSPTQRWWLEQIGGMPADHFNLSSVFRVAESIDMTALRLALDEMLEQHPALCLRLDLESQQQRIEHRGHYVLREVQAGEPRQQCWQSLQQSIDLNKGVLLAVGVASEADASYIAIVVHHLAADEVSGRLFAENLQRLYHRHSKLMTATGFKSVLQPVREALGLINWAAQLKLAVQQGAMDCDLEYWQNVVARGRRILVEQQQLFSDNELERGVAVRTLERDETQTVIKIGSALLRMPPQELVLTAFIRAWQNSLDTTNCLLSLEGHGRESFNGLGDISSTLGWFTSLYPFVFSASTSNYFDLYREVKDSVRRVPIRGFSYLPLRYYKDHGVLDTLTLNPQISFNYLGETVEDESAWFSAAREHAGEDHGEEINEPFKLDVLARITHGKFELTLRGHGPHTKLSIDNLVDAWLRELTNLKNRLEELAAGKGDEQNLLSLADSLVPFSSLAELDAALIELGLPCAGVEEILPLTGMQSGMWLHCTMQPTAYQDQVALRLQQPLDEARFSAAVNDLVSETQALRTGFAQTERGELIQIIYRERADTYQYLDRSSESKNIEGDMALLRRTLRDKKRNLLRDPLFCLTLVKMHETCFELIIDFHHMALDGWTSALLLQRLEALYFSKAIVGDRNAAHSMRTYFEWLGQQPVEQARAYWRALLGDYQSRSDVPTQLPRTPTLTPLPLFVETRTGSALYSKLVAWCEQQGLTINATLQALWGIYLSRRTGGNDIVFGATVSGRDIELSNVGRIAGMLINTLPVRITLDNSTSFADLVSDTAQQFAESMTYGHLSLAEIQTLSPARGGLVTHALVFENYPAADSTAARWQWQAQEIFDPMHFEFGLIVSPLNSDLSVRFVADGSLFTHDKLTTMGTELFDLLRTLLDAHQPLHEISTAGVRGWSISANFTADSLVGLLQYHEYISGKSRAVTLLPYDQSVQELINPNSRLNRMHPQQHIVLWRPVTDEDGKVVMASAFEQLEELASASASFARASSSSYLYFVPCPWQECNWTLYREFTAYVKGALAGLSNCELVSLEHLGRDYVLQQYSLPAELIFGDIPYTEEFFAAVANQLARQRDFQDRSPIKVFVIDADDTLWGGIVGEEGAQGVRLESAHTGLQEQLLKAHAAGALLCLATKNNLDDVRAVFEQRDMPLRWEHLTRVCASWGPKSESILSLAEDLSLGLNSFVFIDDSPLECEEVLSACPGVLAIQLPCEQKRETFLTHLWPLDVRAVSREDALRSQMYAEELRRASLRKTSSTYGDFLASLEIEVRMHKPEPGELARVSQLSQRTNQFNTTGIRYSETELNILLSKADTEIRSVSVRDKYGDYGLAGSIFVRVGPRVWTVFGILLSCRVLGRGVEHEILRQLALEAAASGAQSLHVDFVKLARNAPALEFLRSVANPPEGEQKGTNNWQFLLPIAEAANWQPGAESNSSGQNEAPKETTQEDARTEQAQHFGQASTKISGFYTHLANSLTSGAAILHELQHQSAISNTGKAGQDTATRTPPTTSTESVLAGFFAELLGQLEIFREDSFYNLGGHSLKAMMLFSRIAARFSLTLDFSDLQAYPSLADLAGYIDKCAGNVDQSLAPMPKLRVLPAADSYPISPGQSRLWMVEHIRAAGPSPLHMHATLTVAGKIDRIALDAALKNLYQRHEALRTCFRENSLGEIRQVIVSTSSMQSGAVWFDELLSGEELTARAHEQSAQDFDLATAPLVRIAAGELSSGGSVLFITMHHIISDGWSIGIFSEDLSNLYKQFSQGQQALEDTTEPQTGRVQFRDFASWQIDWLASESGTRAAQFWREHFAEPVEALQLPAAAPRPALMQSEGASVHIDIDKSIWEGFTRRLSQIGVSDFVGLFAALQLVLARLSGQQNFSIGTVVAGRQHQELESVIGFFVNVLPLRTTLELDAPVEAFLRAVAAEVNECLSHQGVPFDTIVSSLDLARDPSRSPLFDVLLVLQNTLVGDLTFGANSAKVLPVASTTSQYDLTISAFPAGDGTLRLIAEYDNVIYSAVNIELILRCFKCTLQGLTDLHGETLVTTPWLDQNDIARVKAFEGEYLEPKPQLLSDIFKNAVPAAKGRIRDASNDWSYGELEKEMQRISVLLRANSTDFVQRPKQTHVGVIGKRSVRSIAAMLGAMEAGAVYIPLDLDNPLERLLLIIGEGAVDILISTDEDGAKVSSELQLLHPKLRHVLYADAKDTQGPRGGDEVALRASDVAYMIFTSGSTGKPKGVQISHRAFSAMIEQQVSTFEVNADDVCGQFAALSFDASLSEVFLALATGASLAMTPNEARSDIDSFIAWLSENAITVITLPPVFLRALNKRALEKLRVLVTAGEAAVAEDMRHYATELCVLNAYGPTETSVCASAYRVDNADQWPFGVPIGKPLTGVLLSVRDSAGARVPIGCTGELFIGGTTLAEGYFAAPALTAEKFSSIPNDPLKARWYRTGDLVRWREDGLLEFLGRADEQLKIRGYRIEPGEIEHAARGIEEVRDAVVLMHPQLGLMLYCLTNLAQEVNVPALRAKILAKLGSLLPRHMIPSNVLLVEKFPLSSSGKISRSTLLTLASAKETQFIAPETAKQDALAQAWQRVLKAARISQNDDFFALGGDSIKALEVVNIIRSFGFNCELKDFFAFPGLAAMADWLKPWHVAGQHQEPLAGNIELLPVQSWFLRSRDKKAAQHFHIVAELEVPADLSENLLSTALASLIQNHDSLRARFYFEDGCWRQEVQETIDIKKVLLRFRRTAANETAAELAAIEDLACRHFDLETEPLVRCVLIQGVDGVSEAVVLTLHHLIADWVSLRILIADLNTLVHEIINEEDVAGHSHPAHLLRLLSDKRAEECSSIDSAGASKHTLTQYQKAVTTMKAFDADFGVHSELHTLHLHIAKADLAKLREYLQLHCAEQKTEVRLQDLLLTVALGELSNQLQVSEIPLLVESHGRDGPLDLARQVAWLTRARLFNLDLDKFTGPDALIQASQVMRADLTLQPDVFTFMEAEPNSRQTLPALMSFNYLGEFANSQDSKDLFRLTGRVFDNAMAATSPVDVPLHMECYVVDYALEIQLAWSPRVFDSETMRACWERVRCKFASF